MVEAQPAGGARPARRRGWRRLRLGLALAAAAYLLAVAIGLPPSAPFDLVINIGGVEVEPGLRWPADGRRRLVVLQHGLWRSPWSLWRLERALVAHDYEVLNCGYPSTRASIEQHAALLHDAIEARLRAAGDVDELFCVGHSMGGLVIQEYLRRADARRVASVVYIATPPRGAVLCDLRKDWWPFRLFMGTAAALQLSPGDPLHGRPIPDAGRAGAIIGDLGDCHGSIPGHDDGTVATDEARLAGAADLAVVELGHTAIAAAPETIRQVLHFLRHGRFVD